MTMNDRFAFERLRARIDDSQNKSVLVIIENDDGTLDSAYFGEEGNPGMFALAFSVAAQLSDEIMATFTPEQKAATRIVYPTVDQARELGLLPFQQRKRD
jgi:hypothetical protein